MSNHLKPCPFCGGDASFNDHTDGCYFTVLRKLKADPPADLSRVPDLIEAWNTRTAIQQAEARTDEPVAWLNPYGGVLTKPQTGLERETHTIPLYTHPAPGVPDDVALTIHELREIERAVDDLTDSGETDVPDRILIRGVMAGYLECTHYIVVDRDGLRNAIDAAMLAAASPAQKGGE